MPTPTLGRVRRYSRGVVTAPAPLGHDSNQQHALVPSRGSQVRSLQREQEPRADGSAGSNLDAIAAGSARVEHEAGVDQTRHGLPVHLQAAVRVEVPAHDARLGLGRSITLHLQAALLGANRVDAKAVVLERNLFRVRAQKIARRLQALAIGAKISARALLAASSAVHGIGRQIHAFAAARRLPHRTAAFRVDARLISGALHIAAAAVRGGVREVRTAGFDIAAVAVGLAGCAGAAARSADLVIDAGRFAVTTVRWGATEVRAAGLVRAGVAVRLADRAGAAAGSADLVIDAGRSAVATVSNGALQVRALVAA